MMNMPEVKLGIVAVSRDCFPITLSESRRKAVAAAYKGELYECPTVVESELDMQKALKEVQEAGCNALVVYLGNFGPETAETLLVKYFDGPCMVVAAAEEHGDNLVQGRGDAYCGMLNASYNLQLRNLKAYIPEYPVGTPEEVAEMMEEFVPIARAVVGLKDLKIITFGPRPQDFMACNAPIKQLFNLGVEFGFVPCYVNSRLTGRGIPVSCEVDIYGALSEFIGTMVSNDAVTLLDINNTVPADMYESEIKGKYNYTHKDTFMGFHCGNTTTGKLTSCSMKYQLIMARSLPEEVTQGTLEGDIVHRRNTG